MLCEMAATAQLVPPHSQVRPRVSFERAWLVRLLHTEAWAVGDVSTGQLVALIVALVIVSALIFWLCEWLANG